MGCEDRGDEGTSGSFAFCARDVDKVEGIEVGGGVADSGEVTAHFDEGEVIELAPGGADGGKDGGVGLEGVEGGDGILGKVSDCR